MAITGKAEDETTAQLKLTVARLEQELAQLKQEKAAGKFETLYSQDANERKNAEKQLREAHQQTFDIFETISDGFVAVDDQWCYTYVNRRAAQMLGRPKEELLGRVMWEVYPKAVESIYYQKCQEARASQTPSQFEYFYPVQKIWLDVHIYPAKAGLAMYFNDITERKQIEQALRESEARFRQVQQFSPDGFTIMPAIRDETGQIVDFSWEYLNPTTEKLLGTTTAELRGQSALTLYPGIKTNGVLDLYKQVVESGISHDSEIHYQGEQLDGWYRLVIVKAGDGIALSHINITRRKQAEERLRFLSEVSNTLASSLDYTTTLQNVTRLVVPQLGDYCLFDLVDEQADNGFRRVAVYHTDPAKEAIVREIGERYPLKAGANPIARILDSGEPQLIAAYTDEIYQAIANDAEHLRLLRDLRPASAMVVALKVRGQVIGALTLAMAESERHYALEDLDVADEVAQRAAIAVDNARLYQEAQKALETQKELDYLKDLFLSVISHELRTPLTSIKGFAQVLKRHLLSETQAAPEGQERRQRSDKLTRPVESIIRQSNRLNDMVNQLLDFSRIQSDQIELNYSLDADLGTLAQRVVEQQRMTAPNHTLLWLPPPQTVTANYDETRLEQVLDNLVSNAIKYSQPGTTVRVGLEVEDQQAVIWVQDEGIGISPEHQAHIFDRFYRARTNDNTKVEGLGLGLYISYKIVKSHGGRLWLTSEVGRGSTFYLALKLS